MMAHYLRILAVCAFSGVAFSPALAHGPVRLARAGADGSVYARWLAQHFQGPGPQRSALGGQAAYASLAINNLEISNDTSTGNFRQLHPAAVEFASRRYMAFWIDEKNGLPELRGRRFGSDLSAVGAEFPLFSDGLVRRPDRPTCRGNGRLAALAWQNGEPYAIRVAFVDSLGALQLEATAGDVANPPLLGYPSVGTLRGGRFLVAWEEFRTGWRVVGQLFDSLGATAGSDLLLDGTPDSLLKTSPASAGDTSGGFCLAWSQGDTRADVFVRAFDSLGAPRGPAVQVTSEVSGESYMLPQVTYLPAANRYVLVYVQADQPADSTALWRCNVRPDGTLDGAPAPLAAGPYPWQPAASVSSGRVVVYSERFDNLGEIRSLAFDAAGTVVENSSVVSTVAVRERAFAAASTGKDTLFVVWQDKVEGDFDIHGLLRSAGATTAAERALQAEGAGGQQTDADVAARLGLGVLAVYADLQNEGDIAQVEVNEAGTILSRRRVSDDTLLAPQYDPHIASTSSGWSFVTWTDERADWPGAAVHAAGRFAQAGVFVAPSLRLSSSGTSVLEGQTDVAMRENKFSTVVWVDDRSGTPRAFMRRFSDLGTALGAEVPLSDGSQSQLLISYEQDPVVAMDSVGTTWTAWTAFDVISDSFVVMVQAWTAGGVRRGTNVLPAVGPTGAPLEFDIAARGDGRARIVWYEAEAANPAIRMAVFDTLGTTVEGPTDVSTSPVVARQPRVAQDVTGRWVVAWSQSSALSDDILWQRFDANGTPSAPIEKLSGAAAFTRLAPALTYSGNFVYGAWHESSVAKGFDVRMSSLLKASSDVQDDRDHRPLGFALHQVFPNPFNGATRISYTLDYPASVSLLVFDALGRRVRVLAHGDMGPGQHELTWDGTDDRGHALGSGVYFCRLQAGAEMESRKLLFLK